MGANMKMCALDPSTIFTKRENQPDTAFTARQISEAVGVSPRAIRDALSGVTPATTVVRGGNVADAFAFDQLPKRFKSIVHNQQTALNYRSPEAVLMQPKKQWQPAVPLARQPAEMIDLAHGLKRSLAFYLQRRNDESVGGEELLKHAVADYETAFKRSVSSRHVRMMIDMVLERDGGREEFERLELYLPRGQTTSVSKQPKIQSGISFPILEDAISCAIDLASMTPAERAFVWKAVLDEFGELVSQGEKDKRAKRKILDFLTVRAPRIAESKDALRKQFDRKLEALHSQGVAGLWDQRKTRSGRRRKSTAALDADELLCLSRANSVGGGISQAFRELYRGIEIIPGEKMQFSEAFRERYTFDPHINKSQVPQSLRNKLRPLLKSIDPLNHGPKAARLASPSIHRDWSDTAAGAWYQSDDETSNNYVWFECEDGEYEFGGMRFDVLRPQILPLVDVRTDYVLSVMLLCQRNYNSRAIRSLILKTCLDERIGLPFDGFYFEQGIWKSRNVQALVSWTEIDEAFSRSGLNLRLQHATTPKAKIIERIFSQEQNAMQELPGYAGRDERNDRYERVRAFMASLKKSGQPRKEEVAPWDGLLSADQYLGHLERAYERFNHEPQNGKRLQGLSPAQAWEKFSGGRPHTLVPDSLRYLLATEQTEKPVTVTREGICLRIGVERRYFFESERLGMLVGEKVNVRWNADCPDHVVVVHSASDPQGLSPFVVPLDTSLDAMNATKDDFAEARRSRRVFTQPQRTLFKILNHSYGKTIRNESLGTLELRKTGEAHHQVEQAAIAAKPHREALEARARRSASRVGLNPQKIKNVARAAVELSGIEAAKARIREKEAQTKS